MKLLKLRSKIFELLSIILFDDMSDNLIYGYKQL
jgi:hypothetical protein